MNIYLLLSYSIIINKYLKGYGNNEVLYFFAMSSAVHLI